MKFLLVYAHPNVKSFNHALFSQVRRQLEAAGHEVRVHDLYAMGFDPVLAPADFEAMAAGTQRDDVARLQADIAWAERLFFTYPIWWYNRPAILQGYIDRVFSYGFAYKFGANGTEKLLKHSKALVFQTTGQIRDDYSGAGDVAIHYAMKEGTLELSGVNGVLMHTFYNVPRASDDMRQQMLDEAAEIVHNFMN